MRILNSCLGFLFILASFFHVYGLDVIIELVPMQRKCYGEELGKEVLLVTEFNSTDGVSPINLTVSDPTTAIIQEKEVINVQKAFTTNQAGSHKVCVENPNSKPIEVGMKVTWGANARDYTQLAKKEDLDPFALKLRIVEDKLANYKKNLSFVRMRDEAGATETEAASNSKIYWMSAFTVSLMILVTVVQVYLFRRFLKKKKII